MDTSVDHNQLDNNSNGNMVTTTTNNDSSSAAARKSSKKSPGIVRYSRIFKKSSQDGNLVLFLPQRDLVITEEKVEVLMGVALVHQSVLEEPGSKVYLQVVLVFRYGREDEELMGLRFCNEIVIAAEQILSSSSAASDSSNHQANSQGFIAAPFALDMGQSAPPSVRLLPCRPYTGAPIGTTYEVQLFVGKGPEEMPKKRKMVQMAVRLYERIPTVPLTMTMTLQTVTRPVVTVEKSYVFSDSNLFVQAKLDCGIYSEDDSILVTVLVRRPGGHGVRRISFMAVQQVSVAMFSTGHFKNNVGGGFSFCSGENHLDPADSCYRTSMPIKIELSKDYSWVAMDETAKRDADIKHLAPSVVHANKSMFIIRVNYYVQVLLQFGLFQRDISIKLPFLLKRKDEGNATETTTTVATNKKRA